MINFEVSIMKSVSKNFILYITSLFFCHSSLAHSWGGKNFTKNNVRGLYLNAFSTKGKRFNDVIQIIKSTNLNSVVVDVKDVRGFLIFHSKTAKKVIPSAIKKAPYEDLRELVNKIKRHNIYTIARIAVFKDNYYTQLYPWSSVKNKYNTPYLEKNKLKWVDPHYKKYWDYIIDLARECYDAGFNEVQFDYIRFPGTSNTLIFPFKPKGKTLQRSYVITNFIRYAKEKLSDLNKPISIDVFGLVGNLHKNDLSIGQLWEKLSPYVDAISPMMYPSHYPKGFAGIKNPDLNPYLTIKKSISRSIKTNNRSSHPTGVRPWIQAFTAKWLPRHLPYGKVALTQQIKALKDAGVNSYLLWHPGSKFKKFYPEVFQNNGYGQNKKTNQKQ